MNIRKIKLDIKGDDRGQLIAIESTKDIPIKFERIFYIFGTVDKTIRGKHANLLEKQALICLSGSCKIKFDDGVKKQIYELNCNNQALFIDDFLWREIYDFQDNCILMCISNMEYKETNYIRDYNHFLKLKNA